MSQQVVCSCAGNTHATCMTLKGQARPKASDRCDACVNGKSTLDAVLCRRWRLVRKRQKLPGKEEKAKKLSAEAAGMPDQPARGVPRAGGHRPQRCPRGERVAVNPFWAGHHMVQTREGGECV